MQIVIPMSGFGERFRKAGYQVPKPLIPVDGKPIIAHVVDMFPGESDFTFIVNKEHLDTEEFALEATLLELVPDAKIVAIDPHKLGPINAVMQTIEYLDPNKPTIVNYCDFTCLWDWGNFKNFVLENNLEGCLPSYRGFHPHSLGTTNYAYIKEVDGKFQDIQEKQPFTSNRMNEYASSGTYYFSSAALMRDSFEYVIENDLNVNGEYYVSMAYKYLAETQAKTFVYPLQHFMQWGTPEDLVEYEGWSSIFSKLITPELPANQNVDSLLMPMAGLGKRFKEEGYQETKPLISVSGSPMALQSAKSLPAAIENIFVLRTDMDGYSRVEDEISTAIADSKFVELQSITEGQAKTVEAGLASIARAGSIVVGACDNGLIFDRVKHSSLVDSGEFDLIVWVARGHTNAIRKPEMFSWLIVDDGQVSGVSVKQPLGDPANDPIVIGTMTFRNPKILSACLERLFAREGKVNGEFYLDSVIEDAINLGFKVSFFEVDSYVSWGTPNDLRTFEYWQSCFQLWHGHPYSVAQDRWVPQESKVVLEGAIKLRKPMLAGDKLVEI